MSELQVKFYLVQNEDCSLRDSTSDSSERLLQRGVGGGQYIRFWWRRRSMPSRAYFTKGFLLVTRNWYYHEGIECFSRYEEMQGLGSWNQLLKISNYLTTCSTRFPGAQSASLSMLNSLQRVLKVSSWSSTGRWQMPLLFFSHWQMLLASANL